MLFGSTRSNATPTKEQSASDIFAVACDLQSQLQVIEERFAKGLETGYDLKRKKDELTEVLRLFQMIEENERNLCKELEDELERALESAPTELASAIQLAPSISDLELFGSRLQASTLHPAIGERSCILMTANVV